jgi:hypothetical protein
VKSYIVNISILYPDTILPLVFYLTPQADT